MNQNNDTNELSCPICYEKIIASKECSQCNAKICQLCFLQLTNLRCPLCRKKYDISFVEQYVMNNLEILLLSEDQWSDYLIEFCTLLILMKLKEQDLFS